jgi:hypothetical protein
MDEEKRLGRLTQSYSWLTESAATDSVQLSFL